jgi:quinoprotein glucose dehydrogenase
MKSRQFSSVIASILLPSLLHAGDERQVEVAKQGGFVPKIADASPEAEKSIQSFKIIPELKLRLWAAEPLLANPVAFATDEKGRWYVAETFRLHAGVSDIRAHMDWLEAELSSKDLDAFLAILKGDPKVDLAKNAQNSERVQLLWDSKGAGKADSSKIFAEGFNGPLDGIAAGVLARKGNVYLTSIPDLWLLKDTKGGNTADQRTSLAKGFGIRTAFLGHDLHGLRMGPDGRLYFSVGDRGANATAIDRSHVENTETGAVYRCNPDGTKLEIFAVGLRNPQELAFDQFGNLFTGDNNSDAGDPARWVYVLPQSDSGWRIGWQFINEPERRGPWLSERLCYPAWPGQPAYHLPPVAILGNGPSGLTYHPGTGLSPGWHNHFFLANFSGTPARSGILSVTNTPKGAGFTMSEPKQPVWNILTTDVEFGTDGSLYLLDWVNGWGMTGKGRIFAASLEKNASDPELVRTKKLIEEGMEKRPLAELAELLGHADMRVRQEAQFEIAARGDLNVLENTAKSARPAMARIHAIWGLGQLARGNQADAARLLPILMKDSEDEIRAQAAKTASDVPAETLRNPEFLGALIQSLKDPSARVRSFAAITLARAKDEKAAPALLEMLKENNDTDPVLRHAAAIGLAGCASPAALRACTTHESRAVRLGAVVALRRIKSAELAAFLADSDPLVVAEAARAIHDESVDAALPAVAALSAKLATFCKLPAGTKEEPSPRDAILRRVLNANFRLGKDSNAEALAQFASMADGPETQRVEALRYLAHWAKPPTLDRVFGLFRPLAERKESVAVKAVQPVIQKALELQGDSARSAALKLIAQYKIAVSGVDLPGWVSNSKLTASLRADALNALAALRDPALPDAVRTAAADSNEAVRKEAIRLQMELHLPGAIEGIRKILDTGSVGDKQAAIRAIPGLNDPAATAVLASLAEQLLNKKLAEPLQIEVLEALEKTESMKDFVARYTAGLNPTDPLAAYRVALKGGNTEAGRKIFMEKIEASCSRCHKVRNEGAEVGPNLTNVASRGNREYLLESIVNPNAKIAQGYETVMITLTDNSLHAGILKEENDTEVSLIPPGGTVEKLSKAKIKSREFGPSGMPPLAAVLSKRELRDLVEYLSSLK